MFMLGQPLLVTIGPISTQTDKLTVRTSKLGNRPKTTTGWSTTTPMSPTGRSNRWLGAVMETSQAVVEVSREPLLICSSTSVSKRKTTNLWYLKAVYKSFKELRLMWGSTTRRTTLTYPSTSTWMLIRLSLSNSSNVMPCLKTLSKRTRKMPLRLTPTVKSSFASSLSFSRK